MSQTFNWFPGQTFAPRRYRPGNIGNWSGHLSFAHDLILALRPTLLVELGTHLGESYFGFCQTIAENNLPCTAYAVDTWEGEPHAGFYDETVFEEVDSYNKENYSHFSYLLRELFDEARKNFSEDSIDLLHIDGLHTFEAVFHDFYGWLPKVKPGGIILLHDIAARHQDFGVWKLWEKLKEEGETFEFTHSWGLGVFRKPGGGEQQSEFLDTLFKGDLANRERIQRYYHLVALELESKHRLKDIRPDAKTAFSVQVYLPSSDGYDELRSQREVIHLDTWNSLSFLLPEGIATGVIRLDPADAPALIDLRGIALSSAFDQQILWRLGGSELEALTCAGTAFPMAGVGENGAKRFLSYGSDPQLLFPAVKDAKQLDQPLILKVWIRVQTTLSDLIPLFQLLPELGQVQQTADEVSREANTAGSEQIKSLTDQNEELQANTEELRVNKEELQASIQGLTEQLEAVSIQWQGSQEELKQLADQNENLQSIIHALKEQLQTATTQQSALQVEQDELRKELNRRQTKILFLQDLNDLTKQKQHRTEELESKQKNLEFSYAELQHSSHLLTAERDRIQSTLDGVLRSHSWRITSPVRKLSEKVKGK